MDASQVPGIQELVKRLKDPTYLPLQPANVFNQREKILKEIYFNAYKDVAPEGMPEEVIAGLAAVKAAKVQYSTTYPFEIEDALATMDIKTEDNLIEMLKRA